MWKVLSFIMIAVFALLVVMWSLAVSATSYVSYLVLSLVITAVVSLAIAILLVIYRDKRNEVLRVLDLDRAYFVFSRTMDSSGDNVMSLQDAKTHENRIAVISGSYPPNGFREVMPTHGTPVLVSKDNPFVDLYFAI